MTDPNPRTERWGFLLDELCQINGVSHAVTVSGDGLTMAHSSQLCRDQADRISAITSGLTSLTTGVADLFDVAPVEQVMIDMRGGHLLVMSIDTAAILTVLAATDADMGQVAYEMTMLINRVGEIFIPAQREPQRA